jgi:A/G-specific adenine glycosylase
MSPIDVHAFRRKLAKWYSTHGRDLPWRRTRDPYAILVSELMLQQTQVATVLPYYNRWLDRFPDFAALAAAPENDVLHAWQGLGYYQRARNLHKAAKIVASDLHGMFPREASAIRGLPGVGRYTANAIATFAFDLAVPIVETNIARLLSRVFDIQTPIDSTSGREELWRRAESLLPRSGAGRFNSALMDLGATVCLPRNPRCGSCPAKQSCQAKDPERLPRKKTRPATQRLVENHRLIVRHNRILLEQSTTRWRNMWILPPIKLDRFNRSSSETAIYASVFPFTNHRVTLHVFRGNRLRIENPQQRWFAKAALKRIPIPSPHRRAITALFSE